MELVLWRDGWVGGVDVNVQSVLELVVVVVVVVRWYIRMKMRIVN